MSMGSSDISKTSMPPFQYRQDSQEDLRTFAKQKSQELQKVNALEQRIVGQRTNDESESDPSTEVTDQALAKVNANIRQLSVNVSFEVADKPKENIIKVIDQDSGEVVRQIPSEEFVKMSERIQDLVNELGDIKGTLINQEA